MLIRKVPDEAAFAGDEPPEQPATAGEEPPAPSARFRAFPALDCPDEVREGDRFTLVARFTAQPPIAQPGAQPVIVAAAPPQLTFVVQVGGFGFMRDATGWASSAAPQRFRVQFLLQRYRREWLCLWHSDTIVPGW